jgi:hypothetical protein
MSESAVRLEGIAYGRGPNDSDRAPDATVDEVGVPHENVGFDGHPIRCKVENGYGTGDPSSGGWAGWGA